MVKVVNGCIGGIGDTGWWCWYMLSDLFVHILPCSSSYQCSWRRLHVHVRVRAYMQAIAYERVHASACMPMRIVANAWSEMDLESIFGGRRLGSPLYSGLPNVSSSCFVTGNVQAVWNRERWPSAIRVFFWWGPSWGPSGMAF